MIGVEFTVEASPLVQACMDRGLLINVTQGNVVRLLPALTSSEAEVHEGCAILAEAIRNFKPQINSIAPRRRGAAISFLR
jgi:acetylornithine/succinyldiaminopimelate/putrescine aminotransferase